MRAEILIFSLLVLYSNCALPSTFKKCNKNQADFNKCLKIAVQDGIQKLTVPIKEIGLPSLDPLEIIEVTFAAGHGAAGFSQKFQNMTIQGFSKCICHDVIFEENELGARCHCPKFVINFNYEFQGRILVLPIQGKGPGSVTVLKSNSSLVFGLERYTKRGKQHYRVTNTQFVMTPGEMMFKYRNLFGGNKALDDNLNQVFNENWKELYNDVGKDYEEFLGKFFETIFARVLSKVSIEELFGEE